jgi:zinc protease
MLDRKSPPPFVHTTTFDLINPLRKKLSNGIELFFIPGGDQQVIKIELVFKAGRWFEKSAGASHFTSQLLNKGTRTKTSFQIAQLFDRYGAHVEIQPGLDFASVSIYGLTKYLSPVVDLLMEIISEPLFPEKELEQHKSIFIQNLKVNEEKTSFLASKAFRKKLFGDQHPYGKELEKQDIEVLTRDHLTEHYQAYYKDLTVFVSGKIDAGSQELLVSAFNGFKNGAITSPIVHAGEANSFHEKIDKEGSVQSSIRMGKRSLKRDHPDYAKTVFAVHILGGYFGSRLMKNIREEKGLTYGIYASLHPLMHDSYFVIGADVNKENVNLTLDEISKELKILRTEKISDEELDTSKNHFIGSLQAEITTPFAHADKIKTIFTSGLPMNFYHQMILAVDAITAEEIMEVTEKHFQEQSLSEVAVG